MKLNVSRKTVFLSLLLVCMFVLLSPVFFRHYNSNDYLMGDKPYFYLRLADYIEEHIQFPENDNFSFGGRNISEELGWPYLLSFNPLFLSFFLPILFGVLSFIIFYLTLIKVDYKLGAVSSLLLITSPSFVYLFTVSNKFAPSIFLSLLAIYLNFDNKKLLSVLCIPLIGFFSFGASLVLLTLYLIYVIYHKRQYLCFLISLFLIFLVYFIQFNKINLRSLFFIRDNVILFLQNFISDFGGAYGIGVFMILLSFMGIFMLWRYKYKFIAVYLSFIFLFFMAYFFNFIIFYLNILAAVLAGYTLINLYTVKWESDFIKRFVIIVLICGLLFSSISFVNRLIDEKPTKEFYDGIYYLNRQPGEDIVFSHYSRGNWISYAGKKNVMDSNFLNAPNLYDRFRDSETLLHSDDINEVYGLIEKYGIKYVFVDNEMVSGLVWNGNNLELLFILKNDERFKKVFDNGYVLIWRVLND